MRLFERHLNLLIHSIVYNCATFTALCDSMESINTEKKRLIAINKIV